MTEGVLPDWVQNKKREKEELARKSAEAEENRLKTEKTLQLDGPEFWKQFSEHLQFNVIACKELGVQAKLSPIGKEESGREGLQIYCFLESSMPKSNYLNVYYSPGSNQLEFIPAPNAEAYRIDLVIRKGDILASSKRRHVYVTAEQLAEDVIQELVESVGG